MRKNGKQDGKLLKFSEKKSKRENDLADEVDALFRLPLAEFTGERNALAARLKKSGRGDEKAEAVRVKALVKPSVSAWAVNQLYWNHRENFDQLIASGERFHKAQASRGGGKIAEMRSALDARREALTHLTDLATVLLRDAAHNPSPDTIHRITTTLEGLSAYASRSDGPRPGRLTNDVDPPGFESFAGFVTSNVQSMKSVPPAVAGGSTSIRRRQTYPPATAGGTDLTTTKTRRKVAPDHDARQLEETRKAKIAAAKVSLQDAKKSLAQARARTQSLEAARKKADAEAQKAEKHKREVETILEKAKAASEVAAGRARNVAVELEEAATTMDDAERSVESASKELELLVGNQ